jgi:hypothetical protein
MAFLNRFEGKYVFGWAIDDYDTFYKAIDQEMYDGKNSFNRYLDSYKKYSYNNIKLLFDNAPIPLNLGGATEKNRLIATDKPMGVFDFSLASMGMYKVPEYFSKKLADEFPNKFADYNLPSGVVPNNLVTQEGETFYYKDSDGVFDCIIQQKGTRAVDLGEDGAKLKYATRNKKVYLTFKKNRGKVKYVEIYSLFYYTNLEGDVQFAVRHIPALMVSDYLESIGIKTRFYMTRFVTLPQDPMRWDLREFNENGVKLPLYEMAEDKSSVQSALYIQPIIVKDFGQDIDKAFALMISSTSRSETYDAMATYSIKKEVTNRSFPTLGQPKWSQIDYTEGFERYRNKYQLYNKLGFFKTKEVLPEAMMFFHDFVIKTYFSNFLSNVKLYIKGFRTATTEKDAELLIDVNVNPFFNWWMRLSANNLKNKIELINSLELVKDLKKIQNELQSLVDELNTIVEKTPEPKKDNFINKSGFTLKKFYKEYGERVLRNYNMTNYLGKLDFKPYIYTITSEITTYAEGSMFETTKDMQVIKNSLALSIIEALQNF